MENFDIFNLSLDNFKTEEKQKSGSDIYKTDPKLAKDSIYRAIVRFLPNLKTDPRKSIVKKFSYWLEDETGAGFYADCPSSVPGEKSIIQDTFWKLFKSESAFDKKQAEKMKRKEYYYSYVLIVKDPQRPEMEGTVQVLRYPRAVKKLIDAQITPSTEDIEMGIEPTNIFDFFEGKEFSLKVTMKGGYWNYDECKFGNNSTHITINGAQMDKNEESRKMIMSLYNESLTSLEDFEYKPWNGELREKIYNYIGAITGNPGTSYSNVASPTPASTPNTSFAGTTVNTTATPKSTTTTANLDESVSQAANSNDGEIEDWLKEFDIK
jgi:hypothetical protein